jgi:hypothetical protein
MRTSFVVGLCGALVLGIAVGPSWAAVGGSPGQFTIVFDEFGNGSLESPLGTPPVLIRGVLTPDPSNGGKLALMYLLPEGVGEGDVGVLEPDQRLTDALRFTDPNGGLQGTGNMMFFYSDVGPLAEPGTLADTGFPENLFRGATGGPVFEDAKGEFIFLAGGPNTYHGISDSEIPEPASMIVWGLLALGFGGGMFYRRLRKP